MQVVSFSPVQIDESRKANVRVPHVLHPSRIMTDAKQGDENQRKFRSSSVRTQCPPVRLLRLVLMFELVVLGKLVPLVQAGLVALNCRPHRHLCVAWLQLLPHQFRG
jgi:hypothetical protein